MRQLFTTIFLVFSLSGFSQQLLVNRNANLRKEAGNTALIMLTLKAGDTVSVIEPTMIAGYRHVITKNGRQGWVYRNLVSTIVPDTLVNTGTVQVQVLDVGAGLCTIIKFPGNKYVIYDAGGDFTNPDTRTLNQIKTVIPAGSTIELMVLSHTDADHILAAGAVINNYHVKKLLWGGYEKTMTGAGSTPTAAYSRIISALQAHPETENVNLHERDSVITPGNHFMIGSARITFLCGFGKPLPEWPLNDAAEKLNAVSIIMKLEYAGNSVLFCGDAVGRHRDDPDNALIATEQFVVSRAAAYLPSTVIIAPHHGAKNGSSTAFVDLVKAKVVIFSAGHKHGHPTTLTANRYLRYTTLQNMFRTDRGDDEGGSEWNYLRVPGAKDSYNDDNIRILLNADHTYRVSYLINQ